MLTGLIIAWAIAVPWLTSIQPPAAGVELAAHTITIWRTQVRFIGAGAIAIAAIFTLAKLASLLSVDSSVHSPVRARKKPRTIVTAISRLRGS